MAESPFIGSQHDLSVYVSSRGFMDGILVELYGWYCSACATGGEGLLRRDLEPAVTDHLLSMDVCPECGSIGNTVEAQPCEVCASAVR